MKENESIEMNSPQIKGFNKLLGTKSGVLDRLCKRAGNHTGTP